MKLWEFQTGAGMNSTVSVFEREGKQYVVAYSAGNVLGGTAKGDSVWLFALDGTLPQAKQNDAQAAPAVVAQPAATANALGSSGGDIYRQACLPCHGPDGRGGHGGGAPLDKARDLASVVLTIREGRKTMPPFGAALTAEQIQAVGAFVVEGHFSP
jgi:mono/diheme cytochrome c family protein